MSSKCISYCLIAICVMVFLGLVIPGIVFLDKAFRRNLNEVENEYCEEITTTCNLSVTGDGDFTLTWYAIDFTDAERCRYKGEEKLGSGWKLIDCFYNSDVNSCPSVSCKPLITDEMKIDEEKQEKNMDTGGIFLVSAFAWLILTILIVICIKFS